MYIDRGDLKPALQQHAKAFVQPASGKRALQIDLLRSKRDLNPALQRHAQAFVLPASACAFGSHALQYSCPPPE
jgi:hypothetical protein